MTMIRSILLWIAAAGLLVGSPTRADGEDQHAEHSSAPEVLAPGWGPLGFTPPIPGSYQLPPFAEAPDGQVLRSSGASSTLYDVFADDVVLLSFIYLSCSDVNGCPLATAVLDKVQSRLGEDPEIAGRLRFVSLSFDPSRDTPEVMGRYAESFAGGGVEWAFLTTASEERLQPILEAYGQRIRKEVDAEGNELGTFSHLLRVFLIDSRRRIRNIYTVSFLHAETLIADVKTLLMEAGAGAVTARVGDSDALSAPELRGPGDPREGYERSDFRTRSVRLEARRGAPIDLFARVRQVPLGLPPVPVPADNALTPAKVGLGRKLFYDRRLSLNDTFSCAMCHIPEQGFTNNELATAVGIEGRSVRRNTPTVYNVAYLERLFHDGRETRLEHQVWGPLLARNEMGNPSIGAVIEKIRATPDYAGLFESAFPDRGLAMETIGMAIASYERTLVSGDSPFDRWHYGKDATAVSEAVQRGFQLFTGKAGCSTCHTVGADAALFTDGALHNTGIGYAVSMTREPGPMRILVAPGQYLMLDRALVAQVSERPPSDLGLYEITQDPADRWKYRTPSLRNIVLTSPYMHDGSLATVGDVVSFYDAGGTPNETLDPLIRPLGLRADEREDLVSFLEALTGSDVSTLVSDAFAAPIGDVR
jgi:cytochrome c peroxidase